MKFTMAQHVPSIRLNESPQQNPLRWKILFKDGDTYEDQSGIFKCKDYLNDLVAKYQGLEVSVYGFNTELMKLNEEGVYVLLTNLDHTSDLMHNLQVISGEAEQHGLSALEYTLSGKDILLFIPRDHFRSTYNMSFLTYLIRIAHTNVKFTSFDSLVNDNPWKTLDVPFGAYYGKIMAQRFKQPVEGWLNVGSYTGTINKANAQSYSNAIHNNGCKNWMIHSGELA